MSETIRVRVTKADGRERRDVAVVGDGEQHVDSFDVLSAFQRQKWRETVVAKFGLDDSAHEWLETELLGGAQRADDAQAEKVEPVLVTMADVEPTEVRWLWRDRIPCGRLTLVCGPPGIGKTFIGTDATARVTTGTAWPDGAHCDRGGVIIVTAEDGAADTLRPRLDAHGADVRRVQLLQGVRVPGESEQTVFTLARVDALATAIDRTPECRLVLVDPLGDFFGGDRDAHRDTDVRAVLSPLTRLADERGVAIVLVAHTRKAAGRTADDGVLGSRGFVGVARAVWHVAADPDDGDRRLLLPGKSNLAARQSGLAFTIEGDPARVQWEDEPLDMHADDVIGERKEQGESKIDAALDTIRETLGNGPRGSRELEGLCDDRGVSRSTYWRARRQLGVRAEKTEFQGEWLLSLPPEPDECLAQFSGEGFHKGTHR
ncbi:MAG: AAA family ATPase [Planctomycetota bacterium]